MYIKYNLLRFIEFLFGATNWLSITRPSRVNPFYRSVSWHPFEPMESCGFDFSDYIELSHNVLQLLVLSDPPATILTLRWSQNLTGDFSVGNKKFGLFLQNQCPNFTSVHEIYFHIFNSAILIV